MAAAGIGRTKLVFLGLGVEGGLVLLAWGLGWLMDQPTWETIDWSWRGAGLGVAACLPMLAVFVICVHSPIGPVQSIQQVTDDLIRPLFLPCSVWELLAISLLAGLGEELLFRALLQGLLMNALGVWLGLAAASALFGLVHWISMSYAVLAALLGLYLGGCWLAADNLLVAVVAHGFYDFCALVYLVRIRRQGGQCDNCQSRDRWGAA